MKIVSILALILTAALGACRSTTPSADRAPYAIVGAEAHKEIVERALAALYNDYKSSWSFTETSTADDETKVATYDPRNSESERWTLVSVDGRRWPSADR